jgi:uncharacterized protein YbbC (DUF1343 family)/CubicO group peptidase (beta-lactamase class C family)
MSTVLLAAIWLPIAHPADVGLDPATLGRIDAVVHQAIQAGHCPGAVVLIERDGQIVHRKAYGRRCVDPAEPMTVDTVFDLASLTKPVATATAVLQLVEQGKLRLDDRVSKHLPAFAANGKDSVTVEQLLLHTSGLIADNALADYEAGKQVALERIAALKLRAAPGERFTYSDVGFIVLGQLVEKLSGQSLDAYTRQHLFEPLGMHDTGFVPEASKRSRIAPTTREGNGWLRGIVHDPRARKMGGVAGHAGLFGTADDLAVFARLLLNNGRHAGKTILQPATVALLTSPREVPGGLRTLGWDARTGYSANRGELLAGFGHTGFTGTSLWIDPASRLTVIVLTNRVHPDGKGNVTALRRQVATLAGAAVIRPPFPAVPMVRTGIDVLAREQFQRLRGKRVALVTNHTGRDANGTSTIDLLHAAPGVQLVALFSPEHGLRGLLDEAVPDGKDEKTGLPVYSLYGKNRRPTKEQLAGVDTLVYDIQDIGCRFYTYITTLGYVLETAAQHRLKVIVLDRPNPIGGVRVEGPVLEGIKPGSFVAYHSIPIRHGMTVGELARLFNGERKIGADLEVIAVEGWRREDLFDRTGLTWVHPSPNMRSLTAALLYPGVGLLETTNVSVGRGTDRPFEVIGAPWIDGRRLAAALHAANLPGLRFVPTRFKPTSSTHAGKECGGVQIYVSDWSRAEAIPLGFTLAAALRQLYPEDWQPKRYNTLLGHATLYKALLDGESASQLLQRSEPGRKAFLAVRSRYLLY